MSSYLTVLIDSLKANFVLTFDEDFGLLMMQYFGFYDPSLAFASALAGGVLGLLISYLLFYAVSFPLMPIFKKSNNYDILHEFISSYYYLFYLLMIIPELCIIIPFFAGLTRSNIIKFLAFAIICKSIYYIYFIYTADVNPLF